MSSDLGYACRKKENVLETVFGHVALHAQEQLSKYFLQHRKKKIIVIAGPTASGKSHLAIRLAHMLGGEIISADSMQVYRGMDIGTAKVTASEREGIEHHLIDIKSVTEPFNVVDFYFESLRLCQDILERDKVPIIAGGSGFYLHAFLYGPPSGPPADPVIRKSLEEELEKFGAELLYERLSHLDPLYCETITKNDKHKIVRALEIIQLTHTKVSDLKWKNRPLLPYFDCRCWFIHRPREILYHRLEQRCDKMIDDGLINETIALDRMGIRNNSTAAQAIGYRQTLEYLETAQSKQDLDRLLVAFKIASRHYAKRQFTWFRQEPVYRWLDLSVHDPEIAAEMIAQDYSRGSHSC